MLAIGRSAAGYPAEALPTDWDWTAPWDVNQRRGAVPSAGLLHAARLASTALVALSLIPLFLAGRRLGGTSTGLLAALLLATDALVLLHGRRSMAEGALMLAVSLVVAGVLWGDRFPWLTGLCLGLALATKQSTLPLLPVGLLGAGWSPGHAAHAGRRLAACCAVLIGVWVVLNPVGWRQPAATLAAMAAERSRLAAEQVADFGAFGSSQLMESPTERVAGLIAAVFVSPPQVREAANYDLALAAAQQAYLAHPLTGLLRDPIGGVARLLLALLGIALGLRRLASPQPGVRRDMALLLLLTLAQVVGLLAAVPLAFQRYYLPLVPLACLWIALALTLGLSAIRRARTGEPGSATV
jgi:4-amino-4-deoxy-L-arabinose transferase-like glycosyltransferase